MARGLVALPIRAQTPQPSAELSRGRVLFESQGARCHGIDGSGGMGANLRRPQLRRAPDDSALVSLIQEGIPDRGMPGIWQISPREAMLFAVYVRTLDKQTLRSFDRHTGTSIMRSYQSTFTLAELDDVIAYLALLQGRR